MEICLKPYNEEWKKQFELISVELSQILLPFKPQIEHFGSTAIPGMVAKPIIDVLVRISQESQLDEVVQPMISSGHIYYKAFNKGMSLRRLFVKLVGQSHESFPQVFSTMGSIPHEEINHLRLAHIHIWDFRTDDWERHLAFRDYLITHRQIAADYAQLKKDLSLKNWDNGTQYNEAKDIFIKDVEQDALIWYQKYR